MRKEHNNVFLIIGFIVAVLAIISSVFAFFVYFEKKRKDEEELEHYLECSIE